MEIQVDCNDLKYLISVEDKGTNCINSKNSVKVKRCTITSSEVTSGKKKVWTSMQMC